MAPAAKKEAGKPGGITPRQPGEAVVAAPMPPAKASDRPPSCANCRWFAPPREVSEEVKANDFRGIHSFGDCLRFPHVERKKPTDHCGEHPSFREI